MSALLQSLLPPEQAGSAPAEAILRAGLPGARSEAWKYTSLRALERRSFAQARQGDIPQALIEAIAAIPAPRAVFVNGFFDAQLSLLADLPSGVRIDTRPAPHAQTPDEATRIDADTVFLHLNRLNAHHGLQLTAAAHVAQPFHLVTLGANAQADAAWHLRHRITLEPGAQLHLIEHHFIADGSAPLLANSAAAIHVGANAQLWHARLHTAPADCYAFLRTDVAVADHAKYQRLDMESGSLLSRHELHVRLQGKNAAAAIDGVVLGDGKRHFDTRLEIHHDAVDTASQTRWRALAAERSRVAFRGGIVIAPGADGSDAQLSSRNLLLSDNAEIDAQPAMEIHADEVAAAHGATVGQLDAAALFYLRSRGIGEAQARSMLIAAFCADVLGTIDSPQLRQAAEQHLHVALTRLQEPA